MHSAIYAVVMSAALSGCAEPDDGLSGFEIVDVSGWHIRNAPTAMALVEPLFRGHPEGMEGVPTLRIDLRPATSTSALVIDVEMGGLLDDAIAAEQYRAVVQRTSGQWRLEALGKRWKCKRNFINSWGLNLCS